MDGTLQDNCYSPIVSISIQGLSPDDGGPVPKSLDLELQSSVLVDWSVGVHLWETLV